MALFAVSVIAFFWYVAFSCLSHGGLAAPPTDIKPNLVYYNTQNTTQGSAFLGNREEVLQYLFRNAQAPEGNFSSGAYPDIAYGVSQCYSGNCTLCLGTILRVFDSVCPLAMGAQMYYNRTSGSCYLRYENYMFPPGNFTTMNPAPTNDPACKEQNSTQPTTFASDLDILMNISIAQKSRAKNGNSWLDHYGNISGYANCYNTDQKNCSLCLARIRDLLKVKCPLAVGATMTVNESSSYICTFQYDEVLPQVSSGPTNAPPPVAPNSSQKSRGASKKIIIIVITCAIVIVLMVSGSVGYFMHEKRYKRKLRDQAFYFPGDPEGNFSYNELWTATEGFQEYNKIGQGGFGDVYKGILADGREVAIKRLHLESDRGKEEFLNEVKIVSSIQHRNLVRMEGYCATGQESLLVLEYIGNGTLDQALHGKTIDLDWPARRSIILGIARGLAYLHEDSHKLIIHRDIKTSNILLDHKLDPKISDFGISKPLDRDRDSSLNSTTRIIGTIGYIAPEYALHGELTDKADVFSFGMLILEIVSGRRCRDQALPTGQRFLLKWSWQLQLSKQLENIIDPALDLTSDTYKAEASRALHIALLCTQQNAESRPKMSMVVTMFSDQDRELPPLPVHSERDSETAIEPDAVIACFAASSSEQSIATSQEAITVLAPR